MKIELPKFLDKKLNKIENLSFCNYIQKEAMYKEEIELKENILIFVQKGTKKLHLEENTIEIKNDSILLLRSGTYIMSEVLDESYEALLFIYKDELLLDFIKKYKIDFTDNSLKVKNVFKIEKSIELATLIDSTCTYFNSNLLNKDEIIKLKLEEAFLNILNGNSKEEFMSLLYSIYKNNHFKIEVLNNFKYAENILEIAEKLKMSEASFRLEFRRYFDTTPKKWQTYKRLQRAKILLETTNKNVSEVCIEVGFDNISWFIQTFKKEFKLTPKQIKNNKN